MALFVLSTVIISISHHISWTLYTVSSSWSFAIFPEITAAMVRGTFSYCMKPRSESSGTDRGISNLRWLLQKRYGV